MPRVVPVTAEDFSREVLFSPVPVVVDVYADRCPPCRVLGPMLERYAEIYEGEVAFRKVNAERDPEVAELFRVESVPTLLVFERGQLTDRIVGLPRVPELTERFDRLAGREPGPCCSRRRGRQP
jgi:thioredoxin 1